MNNDFVNDDIRDIILERDGYLEQLEDYKLRCEKAIEIIQKEKENMGYAKYDSCLLLIENILQNGSDKNV